MMIIRRFVDLLNTVTWNQDWDCKNSLWLERRDLYEQEDFARKAQTIGNKSYESYLMSLLAETKHGEWFYCWTVVTTFWCHESSHLRLHRKWVHSPPPTF